MIISGLNIFRFKCPLKPGLSIRGQKIETREGLVIQVINEQGSSGYGEISPLPGVNTESLTDTQDQILKVRESLLGQNIPEKIEKLNGKFSRWLKKFNLLPSVRFGLEMAILNLKAKTLHKPFATLINRTHAPEIYINGLLQGPEEIVVAQARDLMNQGYHAMKLKVGTAPLEEDIAKVKAVSDIILDKSLLRLDANQGWTFNQALQFCEAIGLKTVEYIEEPFAEIERIPEFFDLTLMPVALDETLISVDLDKIKAISGVEVLVMKPAVLGGFERTWKMIQTAQGYGLEIVISSAFESGLGIDALVQFASCLSHRIPMGLDTLKWFEDDLLKNPIPIEHGRIDIGSAPQESIELNEELLHNITP